MRTRRSPRNQEILWRSLGGHRPVRPKADDVAVIEAILGDINLAKRHRAAFERDLQRAKIRRAKKGRFAELSAADLGQVPAGSGGIAAGELPTIDDD